MPVTSERQAILRLNNTIHTIKEALGIHTPMPYQDLKDTVARFLGIRLKHAPLPGADEGWYRDGEPPEITLDVAKVTDPDRLNFTYFHEITHHLIRRDDELYSFLDQFTLDSQRLTDAIEHYSNAGAAEFLVPAEDVHRAIAEYGFTVNLVETLDALYPASKPAIAMQLANCASHRCFVVICEHGIPPVYNDGQPYLHTERSFANPHLYVRYSARSTLVEKYRVGRYSAIPTDHVITRTYERAQGEKSVGRIPFRSGTNWECECETLYYLGKVYAVFNASPPPTPNRNQPSLFGALW